MTICPACRTLVRRASSLSSAVILRPLMSAAAAVAACRQVFALRGASSHSTVSTHQPICKYKKMAITLSACCICPVLTWRTLSRVGAISKACQPWLCC